MKNKPYSVTGDKDNGFRIAVPTEIGVKKGDRYEFMEIIEGYEKVTLPVGSLVYVPAPRPTSKREKKGVMSG
jgi:hypothetical protein